MRTALLVGWLAHGVALAVDIAGIGSGVPGARFGFAPALSLTLWLVLAVYQLESRMLPLPGARRALAACGVVVVVLAWLFPGRVHPQAGSLWAPLHWLLGIASYGLFGVAVLHGLLLDRAERQMRRAPLAGAAPTEGLPLLRLERLTFRFVAAGFVVLSAVIVLGTVFASGWRWDHKTVFSVLSWLVFAGLLAGRRAFGWRGPQGRALALRRRRLAAARLRRLALRARGPAESAAVHRMKYLIFFIAVVLLLWLLRKTLRRRPPPSADAPTRRSSRSRCWPARTAACTCRATRRCPAAAACSAAKRTAPTTSGRIRTVHEGCAAAPGPAFRRGRPVGHAQGAAMSTSAGVPRSTRPAPMGDESWFGAFGPTTDASTMAEESQFTASWHSDSTSATRARANPARHLDHLRAHLPRLHRRPGGARRRPGGDAGRRQRLRLAADGDDRRPEPRLRGAGDQHVDAAAIPPRRRAAQMARLRSPQWIGTIGADLVFFTGLHLLRRARASTTSPCWCCRC